MNATQKTLLASVVLVLPSLILWGAPALPVALGCAIGAGALVILDRVRKKH